MHKVINNENNSVDKLKKVFNKTIIYAQAILFYPHDKKLPLTN